MIALRSHAPDSDAPLRFECAAAVSLCVLNVLMYRMISSGGEFRRGHNGHGIRGFIPALEYTVAKPRQSGQRRRSDCNRRHPINRPIKTICPSESLVAVEVLILGIWPLRIVDFLIANRSIRDNRPRQLRNSAATHESERAVRVDRGISIAIPHDADCCFSSRRCP